MLGGDASLQHQWQLCSYMRLCEFYVFIFVKLFLTWTLFKFVYGVTKQVLFSILFKLISADALSFFIFSTALASSGTIPITSLDGSNLLFANTSAGNTPNLVTTPLFLSPQNLSLLTSNPVSLVSAGSGGLQVTADTHHQATTAAVPVQASTITTASKAQWSQSGCILN